MLAKVFRSFATKPLLLNSSLKPAMKSTRAPLQAALIRSPFSQIKKDHNISSQTIIPENAQNPTHEDQGINIKHPTLDQMIKEDIGLDKFMTKIYKTTGMSIASSMTLSYLFTTTSIIANPSAAIFGGLAVSILGIWRMGATPPTITYEKIGENKVLEKWTNPLSRQIAFSSIIVGSALMLSPLMKMLLAIYPPIIPMATGISLFIMGGASLYAMYKPFGHFKAWQATLFSTLFGLVGLNISSLLLTALIGPNVFSLACGKVDLYVGIGLFTAFQAFDTYSAVESYKNGKYDHLMHAVDFFLNFKNLFVRIAEVIVEFWSSIDI